MIRPKHRLQQILDMDISEIGDLPSMRRHATHGLRFWYRVIRRFVEDQCIQRASALAYASLLAIVPLVALGFSVFTSFQAFNEVASHVRDLLLQYLLPTSQEEVQAYLEQIAGKAGALSIFGIIGLLFTATALLNTTEEAFNHIWRITRTRPWLSKFMTFWATLTLAPVLLGASITITSYFTALPIIRDVAEGGAGILGEIPFLVPWLMSSLALAFLYMLLPNTTVPFRYAIVGGMIAGGLFELTKIGFAFYVTKLANYELLYGALGTLPIFLLWLYLVWGIVLFGAETAFSLQHPEQSEKESVAFLQPGVQQFFSYLILLRAAEALAEGRSLGTGALLRETGIPDNILQEWLDHLAARGLMRRTADDAEDTWTLGQDAERLTLSRIHHALNAIPMHIPDDWQDSAIGRTLSGLYFRMDREQQAWLGAVSIRALMDKDIAQEPESETHD